MTQPIPQNWTKCQKEIDSLLRYYDPEYELRTYLNPGNYIYDIAESPSKYPLLSQLSTNLQKRHISTFLKLSGRISRGNTIGAKKVWVLPEAMA